MQLSTIILSIFPLLSSLLMPLSAQIIWQEEFSYPDSTVTGANNNTANPAADWTTVCAGCVGNDWFAVYNNRLEGRDTNGTATFLTEQIDISAFSDVQFSLNVSEAGNLDDCTNPSCNCGCIDWLRLEYSLDGGAFVEVTSANGGTCSITCAPDNYLTIGDFAAFTHTVCPLSGNSLQIRVSVQIWAASEYLRIDSLVVSQQNCILPTGLSHFEAIAESDNSVRLDWTCRQEDHLDFFVLERSQDLGEFEEIAQFPAQGVFAYSFLDKPYEKGTWLYRLRMVGRDGQSQYSDLQSVTLLELSQAQVLISPNPVSSTLILTSKGQPIQSLQLIDFQGKVILSHNGLNQSELNIDLSNYLPGIYFYQVLTSSGIQVGSFLRIASE